MEIPPFEWEKEKKRGGRKTGFIHIGHEWNIMAKGAQCLGFRMGGVEGSSPELFASSCHGLPGDFRIRGSWVFTAPLREKLKLEKKVREIREAKRYLARTGKSFPSPTG